MTFSSCKTDHAVIKPGCIFTPPHLVDRMVKKLFAKRVPTSESKVLDAGCGLGAFIDGILRWCKREGRPVPRITGVEIEPEFIAGCRAKYRNYPSINIIRRDFLLDPDQSVYEFIISNPPYLSIEHLTERQRAAYKRRFKSAVRRFDTYILFFERAMELLTPGGRLVFVTPEKFMYTLSASSLRKLLAAYHVEEVELVEEGIFGNVIAYPAVTAVNKVGERGPTRIMLRDGTYLSVDLPRDGSPWLPLVLKTKLNIEAISRLKLRDISTRVSCGVATGEDRVFVLKRDKIPTQLRPYAWPTVSGRELSRFEAGATIDPNSLQYVMLVPYDEEGRLLSREEAKPLIDYLSRHRPLLKERYCVAKCKKKWYAFHEDPPMKELLKPKILCKDIAKEPEFWADYSGKIIPKHNVYYIVLRDHERIPTLLEYLNSYEAKLWLMAHCQRAANNFLRLQSSILKQLPIKRDILRKTLDEWSVSSGI